MSTKVQQGRRRQRYPLADVVFSEFVPVPPLPKEATNPTGCSSPTVAPHKLFVCVRGNPNGAPVLLFHGGPGYYSVPEDTTFFNPSVFCIISYDQRGSGRSVPAAHEGSWDTYRALTVEQMVNDAECVRQFVLRKLQTITKQNHHPLGGGDSQRKCCVAGWSWGSALALAYAQRYPHVVANIALQGIYFGSVAEHGPLFQAGEDGYRKATSTTTVGEAFQFFSDQVENILRAMPPSTPPNENTNQQWVQDPFTLHNIYRDFVFSFTTLQQDAIVSKDVEAIRCTTAMVKEGSKMERKGQESDNVATFFLPSEPCPHYSVKGTQQLPSKQYCCIEQAHRALAIWSLYENLITYPEEQEYYLDKMRKAADTSVPYRASHKDITGGLMQLMLFTQMMALDEQCCGGNGDGSCRAEKGTGKRMHAVRCPTALSRLFAAPKGDAPRHKLWIVHGADDQVCPPTAARALAAAATTASNTEAKKDNKKKHKDSIVHLQVVADASHDAHDEGGVTVAFVMAADLMADDYLENWL